jgi:hypothetical protein
MHTNSHLAVYVHFAHNIYPCVSFLTHSMYHMRHIRYTEQSAIYLHYSQQFLWMILDGTNRSFTAQTNMKKNNAYLNIWHLVWRKLTWLRNFGKHFQHCKN